MNKKMSKVYDKQKFELFEREKEIDENKRKICELEKKISNFEFQSANFEKAFVEANSEVIQKLDQVKSEQKAVNSKLLLGLPKERDRSLSLLSPIPLPNVAEPSIHLATDPVWERTRLVLENEKDKERSERLQMAYSNTFR